MWHIYFTTKFPVNHPNDDIDCSQLPLPLEKTMAARRRLVFKGWCSETDSRATAENPRAGGRSFSDSQCPPDGAKLWWNIPLDIHWYPIEPKDVLLNVFITCIFWNLSEGHKGPSRTGYPKLDPRNAARRWKKKGPVGYPHRDEFPRDFINCHPSFPSEMSIFFGQMSPVDERRSESMLLQQTTSGGFLK